MRWATREFIATAIFAILYSYWLITPVFQYLSIGRWRLCAIVVGGAFDLDEDGV